MNPPRPLRFAAIAALFARWALLFSGLYWLVRESLEAFGGAARLWLFDRMDQHRLTAASMLTGTLRLRSGLAHVGHDEQVFNGAGYTNWGFGVPLLQLPFHAIAPRLAWVRARFFPDRAIYFVYFVAFVPVLWGALDRLADMLRPSQSRLARHVVSWSATWFVLACAFYPLMSCRFIIYEETICYFMLAELLALSAYLFALDSWSTPAVVGLGAAAGLGLLIRPTGVFYVAAWGALLLLERRTPRALASFAGGIAPFVAFWAYGNWVRTGSVVGVGIGNSLPGYDYHTPMLRFGSTCLDTREHALDAAMRLFRAFFFTTADDPNPWLTRCHFDFEERPPAPGGMYERAPFFGPWVLAALVWIAAHQASRGRRGLAGLVPIALIGLLFGTYVWAGAGFAWRYVGDFWPLIVLAVVLYARSSPPAADVLLGGPAAAAYVIVALSVGIADVEPTLPTLETSPPDDDSMRRAFYASRYDVDPPYPSRVDCGNLLPWPYHNGQGWGRGCEVGPFTSGYVGVPRAVGGRDRFQLVFHTEGMHVERARVYLNGRVYVAGCADGACATDVTIHESRLTSRIVMFAIEWTRGLEPVPGRLDSVELL